MEIVANRAASNVGNFGSVEWIAALVRLADAAIKTEYKPKVATRN